MWVSSLGVGGCGVAIEWGVGASYRFTSHLHRSASVQHKLNFNSNISAANSSIMHFDAH
jgi:hypothetical protein